MMTRSRSTAEASGAEKFLALKQNVDFFFFSKDEAADAGHMNILCQDFLFYTPCGYWLLNLPGVTGSVCYRNEQDR